MTTNWPDDKLASSAAPLREVRYEVSRDFVPLLAEVGVSLLVSTYQAGKLVVVGTQDGKLALSFHNFEQAMGLARAGDRLAVGTRYQVWELAREAAMARQITSQSENRSMRGGQAHFAPSTAQNEPVPDGSRLQRGGQAHFAPSTAQNEPVPDGSRLQRGGQAHFASSTAQNEPVPDGSEGIQPYDDCYLARKSHFTGQIHVHELAFGEGEELWIVNTLFSCLATLDDRHSFVPRWRPKFISGLAAEDRCHLNGLAMQEGRPKYVTAMSETDEKQSWRPTKATSGCVIDVSSNETIARGLAMPHSPRLAGGRLWVLNSGLGDISYVEPEGGKIVSVERVPGYTRGLAFHGPLAFIGMSRIRETSTFDAIPIAENRESLRCGVAIVDMRQGKAVAYIEFKSGVEEIFAVEVVPSARMPFLSGPTPTDDAADAVWIVPPPGPPGVLLSDPAQNRQGRGGQAPFAPSTAQNEPVPDGSRLRRGGQAHFASSTAQNEPVPGGSRLQRGGQAHLASSTAQNEPVPDGFATSLPSTAEQWNEYGGRLMEAGQHDAAAAAYRRAIELKASCGAAWANLAFLTADRGQTEAGRQLYTEAYRHQPSPQLRIVQATVLPPVFRDVQHVEETRARFEREVDQLVAEKVAMDPTRTTTPSYFFLAYQGYNDREVMAKLGSLAPSSWPEPKPRKRKRGERIRLGFLSQYLCDHTIGQLNVGIVEEIDKEKFEVVVLAASSREDEITRRLRSAASRYVELPHDVAAALTKASEQELDILHYPDIGMSPFTYGLAHSRLAPVQTTTWGHPVTSGLPTIDHFISCEHGETSGGDEHYTERLVRLPRLNACLARPKRHGEKRSREHFGLPAKGHVYACPQMLFKFHPAFDEALAGILRRDPEAIVATIDSKYPEWRELIVARWRKRMPDVVERICFVPKMPRSDFLELLAVSDVMLDPFPFGGGHTSYEALALGLPVVTLPGEFLRGRLTYAMYQQMGFTELVASSTQEYVELATRLANDLAFQRRAKHAIEESCDVLFDDRLMLRELEGFWESVAR